MSTAYEAFAVYMTEVPGYSLRLPTRLRTAIRTIIHVGHEKGYRGTSLIRNRPPPRTTLGTWAYAFCRVLGGGSSSGARYPCTSLTRKRPPLVPGGSKNGGCFLISEVPLYVPKSCRCLCLGSGSGLSLYRVAGSTTKGQIIALTSMIVLTSRRLFDLYSASSLRG